MFRNAYTEKTITSENYIGIARSGAADTEGAIHRHARCNSDNLSGANSRAKLTLFRLMAH